MHDVISSTVKKPKVCNHTGRTVIIFRSEGGTQGKERVHGVLRIVMKGLLMHIKKIFALENASP